MKQLKRYYPHFIAVTTVIVSASIALKWPVPLMIISTTLLLALFLYSLWLDTSEDYVVQPRKKLIFTIRHINKDALFPVKPDGSTYKHTLTRRGLELIEQQLVEVPADFPYMDQINDICLLYQDAFSALDDLSYNPQLVKRFHEDDEQQKRLGQNNTLLLGAIHLIKDKDEKTKDYDTLYLDTYVNPMKQLGSLDELNEKIETIIGINKEGG